MDYPIDDQRIIGIKEVVSPETVHQEVRIFH